MKDNVVALRVRNEYQEELIKYFCKTISTNGFDDRILGIGIVKKDIIFDSNGRFLKENEKLLIIENSNYLDVRHILKRMFGFEIFEHFNCEMYLLKSNVESSNVEINIVKAFKYKDIVFMPINDVMIEYKKYRDKVAEIKKIRLKVRRELEKNIIDNEKIEKLYFDLDLPKDEKIDKVDYLKFYLSFGNNFDYYNSVHFLKEKGNLTWKEIFKIKYGIPSKIKHNKF